MATSPGNWYGQWFEYEKFVEDMDWFNMMAYDFNGSWSAKTGHNAPLFAYPNNTDGSGSQGASYLNITRKIPKDKIVFGIPFYGKVYKSNGLNQTWTNITENDPVPAWTYRTILDRINSSYI